MGDKSGAIMRAYLEISVLVDDAKDKVDETQARCRAALEEYGRLVALEREIVEALDETD